MVRMVRTVRTAPEKLASAAMAKPSLPARLFLWLFILVNLPTR